MTEEIPPNKYGTTPYSPTNAQNIGEEPHAVRLTKTLIWPLLALHVFSSIIGLVSIQSEGAAAYFEQNLPPGEIAQVTPDMLETMYTASLAFFIGFAVLNVILFFVVGLGLRANKNWARFVGLVLAILFLISAAYTLLFATPYGDLPGWELLNTIVSWVIVLVTVWWIIQALNKRTSQWFAMHRQLQG